MSLEELTWQCGDCGNTYEYSVTSCPNKGLDKLFVSKSWHDIQKAREINESQRTA